MTEVDTTAVLFQLYDLGIKLVKIEYDAYAGDGEIIDMIYCEKLDAKDRFHAPWNPGLLLDLGQELYDAISKIGYSILKSNFSDWETDPGSYGFIGLLIPSGEYEIQHQQRKIVVDSYIVESGLFDNKPKSHDLLN